MRFVDGRCHSVWRRCQKYSAVTCRIYRRSAGPLVFGASRRIPTRVSGSVATRGIMLPAYRCRVMNVTLLKALVALVPACMLFSGSMVLSLRGKTVSSFLQLLGAGCLVLVVLTHVAEALHLFPWMHWGSEHSVGHYIDLWSAVLGLTLFPIGYLFHALTTRRA